MGDTLLEKMLTNTYTWTDFYRRFGLLQEFLEHHTFAEHHGKSIESVLEEFLTEHREVPENKKALSAWGHEFYMAFTKETMYTLLQDIPKAADALPTITLYIPRELPTSEIESLGHWVRENVAPKALINLSIDQTLAVGCAFVWNGVYHDFSFKHLIHKHRESLVKKIHEYGGTKA